VKNRPELVMDFLIKNLNSESEKLVILVPLKCEKYFADGRIDQVTDQVRKSYSVLLEHMKVFD